MVVRERGRKKRKTSRRTQYNNTRRQNRVRKQQSKRQTNRRRKTNKMNRKRGKRSYKKYSRERIIQEGGMERENLDWLAKSNVVYPETSQLNTRTQSTPTKSSGCFSRLFRRKKGEDYEDYEDRDKEPEPEPENDDEEVTEEDRNRLNKQKEETWQLWKDVNKLPLNQPIPSRQKKVLVQPERSPDMREETIRLTFHGCDRAKHFWSPGCKLGFKVERIVLDGDEVLKVIEVTEGGPISIMLKRNHGGISLLPRTIDDGYYFYYLENVVKTPVRGNATVGEVGKMIGLLRSRERGGLELEFVKHYVRTPPRAKMGVRPNSAPPTKNLASPRPPTRDMALPTQDMVLPPKSAPQAIIEL